MSEYGPLLSAPTIERAAETTMRTWLGAYLGEVLVQAGHDRDGLPDPSDFARVIDVDQTPTSNLALAIVATNGTDGDASPNPPSDDFPHGTYSAVWTLRAGVLVALPDFVETREAAQFYAAATVCLSAKGLDGLPDCTVHWRGEEYRRGRDLGDRTLMIGLGRFWVYVPDARSRFGGPSTPPDPPDTRPPGDPDEVEWETNVEADRLPDDG